VKNETTINSIASDQLPCCVTRLYQTICSSTSSSFISAEGFRAHARLNPWTMKKRQHPRPVQSMLSILVNYIIQQLKSKRQLFFH
uniref:Ovule protein n=1 Tax=Haemonchus contortus TaxID=6289 RepID=A0A7I5EA43_HAECO